jgi:hypothetical protein
VNTAYRPRSGLFQHTPPIKTVVYYEVRTFSSLSDRY